MDKAGLQEMPPARMDTYIPKEVVGMAPIIDTLDNHETPSEQATDIARTFEPPAWALPAWIVEEFESLGGAFSGKQELPDGSFTITGIERFSDGYVHEVALGTQLLNLRKV